MSNYIDVNMTVKYYPIDKIEELTNYIYDELHEDLAFAFNEEDPHVYEQDICFWGINSVNWGISNDEMAKLSRRFPDALFILDNSTGYVEDLSREYWKNGKYQVVTPEIIWAEYNPDEMEEVTICGNA